MHLESVLKLPGSPGELQQDTGPSYWLQEPLVPRFGIDPFLRF